MAKTDTPEVVWRKSRRSGGNGGACVEVAAIERTVAARDSKNPEGGILAFSPTEWSAFANRVKNGDLDLT